MKLTKRYKQKNRKSVLWDMQKEAKWILPYIRRYWRYIFFYIVMGAAGTGMGLAGSVASKYLIDAVTGDQSIRIGFLIPVMLFMALGSIVVGAVSGRISTKINLKVNNEIQADIFMKIMNTDWENVSEYHSGDLLNRFSSDVATIAGSVIGWIPALVTRMIQFFGTLAIILYYDATMALMALLSAPVTMILSKLLMLRMRDYSRRVRQVSSEIMSFNEEAFQNIQLIKCFNLPGTFGSKLRSIQKKYTCMSLAYNKFSIYTSSFLSVVGLAVSYATFGWGAYRLWKGYITYGTMTLFLQLSGNLSGSFSALVSVVPSAIQAATAAGRIMEITDLPKERIKDKNTAQSPEQEMVNKDNFIELSHLDFGYKKRGMILKDLCFKAAPHEIVAVIGPSGEGKTTLLRILLGLVNPVNGKAKLSDGFGSEIDISNATRNFFSYVPQGNTLFSGTIADNLKLIKPEATKEQMEGALKAACAFDFVQKLPDGINTRIGEKGDGFSEGQIQRLSIARAVLRDAPIILLDEATSALDVDTERSVLQGIMAYGKTHTCILTTHKNSVTAMCDRVYCIKHTYMEEMTDIQETKLAVDF